MIRLRLFLTLILAALLLATATAAPSVEEAFRVFWQAPTIAAAIAASTDVVQSGVSFADAYARLKRGRPYAGDVETGIVSGSRQAEGLDFPYTLDVPAAYDPARSYQVRVQLHGGVSRPKAATRGGGSIGSLAGRDQIYVLPQSWDAAPWWAGTQVDNVLAILDRVKRRYNVDENRVVMSGVSDGGTGAYFFAMRETTPFASFLPLNGFVMVLRNRDLRVRGALFPHNMVNKPWFVVNGGQDPLYPTSRVSPVIESFARRGLPVTYRPQPDAGHDTKWWPQLKDEFETFVAEHPRQPHPETITWQTDDISSRNRAHWLVIDALAPPRVAEALPDINDFDAGEEPNFGVRANGMRVASVLPGSNAQDFGFEPGDVVVSVNGRTLPRGVSLTELLSIYEAGSELHFVIARDNQPIDLKGTYQPRMTRRVSPLFSTNAATGRVDIERRGNEYRASTRGVGEFTLLLSPDVVDFSKPITVVANGRTVFSAPVTASVATLLKWASRDNDRTMLYGAEVHVNPNP